MGSSSESGKARLIPRILVLAGLAACVVLLAACGSSSSSSSSSTSTNESAEETETAEGTETTAADEGGGSKLTTVYAEGVPTLEELYEEIPSEGPPKSGPKAATGKEVIWVSCGQEAPGCAHPAESFLEAAKAIGWKAKIVDGHLDANNGYATAIRTAIAAQPDAIVTHGINCNEAKTSFEEAKAAGIPLVEASNIDCSDPRIGGEKLITIGEQFNKEAKDTAAFYTKQGEHQAAYAIDATEGKAKVILVEFEGLFGKNIGEGQRTVLEKCSECEILETIGFQASEEGPNQQAYQKFNTALIKYPEANAAIFAFDSNVTYTGLSKAVVDAGRAEDMTVVGGEGFSEAVELVREGKGDTAEGGAWDNSWASWGIADEINRYFNGEPSAPEGIGLTAIDKDHNMPPKGQDYATKVDYKKAYEEIWNGK
jgi:ribose transport system substrate-binding protein